MSELRLNLFGAPRLDRDGQAIVVESRKALALLAYLAVTQQAHSRDTIAVLFWPDLDHTGARATLRSTLWMLKKVCGEWVEAERETIAIKAEVGAEIDVVAFERTLATCRTHGHPENVPCPACLPLLDTAVELYKGDFLEGFTLRDSPGFEDWQILYSENLRHQFAQALECLTKHHEGQGAFDIALRPARRWLALDPLHEPAHQALMRLYAQAGQVQSALRQYDLCRQALEKELGVSPQRATQELYRAIQEDRLQAYMGKPATLKGNLSAHMPPTSFIGRENDLAEIAARLDDSACRLLTLIGPGGIGKTRMALQASWQLTEKLVRYPDGVFFVPLSGVQSPEFLVSTIVTALHFPLSGPIDPKAQLLNYLREKHMLLVLDNFEQLVEGKDLLHDILAHTRAVKLLVTSRERLMLADEWLYEVLGLTYPTYEGVETFQGFSSVELFLQRAQRRHSLPSFWEREKQGIVRICQLVQGMPLGVELAATWVRGLSCQEIAQELERNLDRLSTTHQNLPDRHRSIRAVFDQSWVCLTEAEQVIFCRLSVFRGGFRREAAEQVTGASLPVLMSLVDKSFLQRDSTGRYTIHELLRQYASEKLRGTINEYVTTRTKHCEYFVQRMSQWETLYKGPRQQEAIVRFTEEADNVRGTWDWAIESRLSIIGEAIPAATLLYSRQGWHQEGCDIFERIINAFNSTNSGHLISRAVELIGKTMARSALLLYNLGRFQKASLLANEGLSIFRTTQNTKEIAFCLHVLGRVMHAEGKFSEAKNVFDEALKIRKELNDTWEIAASLTALGFIEAMLKNHEQSLQLLQEGLVHWRATGDPTQTAWCLNDLGVAFGTRGNAREGKLYFEESLVLYKATGNRWGIANTLRNLGYLAFLNKEYHEGKRLIQESFLISRELNNSLHIILCTTTLGDIAVELEEYQEAFQHYKHALKVALELEAVHRIISATLGIATILAKTKMAEPAIEILTFIVHHPKSDKEMLETAHRLLGQLETETPTETRIAAQERGKARTLESIVSEILAKEPEAIASP